MKLNKKTVYELLIAGFVLVMSVITIQNYNSHSFMFDELYTLSFVSKKISFADMMHIFMTDEVTNPPLYDIVLYFWYRIVPAKEAWLLLPNLIFFIIALFFLGALIKSVSGKIEYTLLIMMIAWVNHNTFNFMLYYLRSYSLAFMFSAMTLYLYYKADKSDKISDCVKVGIVMTCVALTHYYGIFLVSAFGIYTFLQIILKKKSWKHSVAYLIAGSVTGIYLLIATAHRTKSLSSFWGNTPDFNSILDVLHVYFVDKDVVVVFALVLIGSIVAQIFSSNDSLDFTEKNLWRICFVSSIFVISVVFIYGRYINPEGSIFINKYFLVIYPEVLILFVLSIDFILKTIDTCFVSKIHISDEIKKSLRDIECIGICIIYLLLQFRWNIVGRMENVFELPPKNRSMAEYILSNPSDSTALLVYRDHGSQWDVVHYPVDGFREFYLGDRSNDIEIIDEISDAKKYDKICLWYTMFTIYETYDREKNKVAEHVLKDMSGFHFVEAYPDAGLLIFEKN